MMLRRRVNVFVNWKEVGFWIDHRIGGRARCVMRYASLSRRAVGNKKISPSGEVFLVVSGGTNDIV